MYMVLVPAYVEYTECADANNDTSDAVEDINYKTGNALLEVLTMPGSSPAIQRSLQG